MSEYSEAEQLEMAKGWLKVNGPWILAGIAIAAGGLGGYRWYMDRRNAQAETASARYEELLDAFTRNDRTRGETIAAQLNADYGWTPYAALGTLVAARVQVDANELDKSLTTVQKILQRN